MKRLSKLFLYGSLAYALGVIIFIRVNQPNQVQAATNHIVISQIQIAGATANDEFVELYNPTDVEIDLAKWRLSRKTQAGTASSSANLVASLSGTIAPKGYFLIAPSDSQASSAADSGYSTSTRIANNSTLLLYSDAGVTLVDKVGLGSAQDVETTAIGNPEINGSAIRKATSNSTVTTLSPGGSEAAAGNGQDTDNNATDFVLSTISFPRSSTSQPTPTPSTGSGPTATPTPTSVPTPTTQPTVIPTNTPTPTVLPTATLTPAPTATPKPTNAPTPTTKPTSIPTPTAKPTLMPTAIPTATSAPTPTNKPTPTMKPMPTPAPSKPRLRLVCTQTNRTFTIFGMHFSIPSIHCRIVRVNN